MSEKRRESTQFIKMLGSSKRRKGSARTSRIQASILKERNKERVKYQRIRQQRTTGKKGLQSEWYHKASFKMARVSFMCQTAPSWNSAESWQWDTLSAQAFVACTFTWKQSCLQVWRILLSPWVPASSEGSTTGKVSNQPFKGSRLKLKECTSTLVDIDAAGDFVAAVLDPPPELLLCLNGKYFVETCAKLVLSLRRNGCVRFPGLSNIFLLRFSDAKTNFKPLEIR